MPRTLSIFFPDGKTEYWFTGLTFEPGVQLERNGETWIVTSIGETDGHTKHMSVTVRRDGDESPSHDGNFVRPS